MYSGLLLSFVFYVWIWSIHTHTCISCWCSCSTVALIVFICVKNREVEIICNRVKTECTETCFVCELYSIGVTMRVCTIECNAWQQHLDPVASLWKLSWWMEMLEFNKMKCELIFLYLMVFFHFVIMLFNCFQNICCTDLRYELSSCLVSHVVLLLICIFIGEIDLQFLCHRSFKTSGIW
jgi:hypothetical protein